MERRRTWAGALALALAASVLPLKAAVTHAATGDQVASVQLAGACGFPLSVGIAFDGSSLWYSCYGSPTDLYRADPRTGAVTASYSIAGGLGALAYDARRNAIWAAYGGGSSFPGNVYQGPINQGDIYLIQLDSSHNVVSASFQFNDSAALVDPSLLVHGLAYDAQDDSLYISPEGTGTIYHTTTGGAFREQLAWAGQSSLAFPCVSTGLAVGGEDLVEASDRCGHVFAENKTTKSVDFSFSTPPLGNNPLSDQGITCDTTTFGEDVVWTVDTGPMLARAFELPAGTCGVGGEPSQAALAPTKLTYSGATAGDFDDPARVSATLTDGGGNAVVGVPVTFTLGTQTCEGNTDSNGSTSCSITPQESAGSYTLAAAFAGDASHLPSNTSAGFGVTPEETTLSTNPGTTLIADHGAVTLSAVLKEDGSTAISGRLVSLTLGNGAAAQTCAGTTDAGGAAQCTIDPVTVVPGPQTITASFSGDGSYQAAANGQQALVYAYPASGSFVIGDKSAVIGSRVIWWGASWPRENSISGGAAPAAFKGFATSTNSTPPACGGSWQAGSGNSSNPPGDVPSYMAVAVTGQVTKAGSTISGNIKDIVIVRTDPSYRPDPSSPGTGTVQAVICQT